MPPEMVQTLLHTVRKTYDRGDRTRAGALLQSIAAQAPENREVWQMVADLAETPDQRLAALERLAALNATPGATVPPTETAAPPPHEETRKSPETTPVLEPDVPLRRPTQRQRPSLPRRRRFARWDRLALGALALIAVIVLALLVIQRPRLPSIVAPATATPVLAAIIPTSAALPTSTADVVLPATLPPADTTAPPPAAATSAPATTPLPTPPPAPTTAPQLPLGAVLANGQWQIALLRPGDALLLDGSIGAQQPQQGRFALALVAVINNGPPAPLPADLVAIVDGDGRRYTARPALSTIYLDLYGRGVRGDLSHAEDVPGDGASASIPLIFDLPDDADDLMLVVGDADTGWAIASAGVAQP
jgi:hypothetical protein